MNNAPALYRSVTRLCLGSNRVNFQMRGLHTLDSAVSFCAKGSVANKNKQIGEDSAIVRTWITPGPNQAAALVGVADGVGGWRRHGVDPSFLSRGILQGVAQKFDHEEESGTGANLSCQHMLTESFRTLLQDRKVFAGGSTVCFGQFDPQKAELELINIGDSGALLIRDGTVAERTVADIDGMTPRQLTVLPPWMMQFKDVIEPDAETQTKAVSLRWSLKKGDVLVFATDGIFDNVAIQEIAKVVSDGLAEANGDKDNGQILPALLADRLLMKAYYNSLDPDFASPFALRYLRDQDGFEYWGGKPDDITLVVSIVKETNSDLGLKPVAKL